MSRPRPDDAAPGAAACARCSRVLTASCCEVKPHERLATLTWADVARVEAATGLAAEAFSEWEWLDADHAQAWLDVHPVYRGYLDARPRRLTLKAEGGACALLAPGRGCTLPVAARPTPCRLYPFDAPTGMLQVERFGEVQRARQAVAKGVAHACLAVEESQSLRALYRAFGTTASEVRQLGERLRTEVAEHALRERHEGPPQRR